jgi:hypothetical protein
MISPRLQQRDSLLFVYGTLRRFCAVPVARRLRGPLLRCVRIAHCDYCRYVERT